MSTIQMYTNVMMMIVVVVIRMSCKVVVNSAIVYSHFVSNEASSQVSGDATVVQSKPNAKLLAGES